MPRKSDLRPGFRLELAEVDQRLNELIHLVADTVHDATEALLSDDKAAAVEIQNRTHLADPLYQEVERKVVGVMAREAPMASDLQYLLAVVRVVPELEQSAALADGIARKGAQGLCGVLSPRTRAMLTRTGDVVTAMWAELARRSEEHGRRAQDGPAAAERPPEQVGPFLERGPAEERIEAARDELDDLHTSLTAEVAAIGLSASATMDMALIGRFYERLGDHAVNIARRLDHLRFWPSPPTAAST